MKTPPFILKVTVTFLEKTGEILKKAEYALEVVKDKAGNMIGLVRDKAGNVAEAITKNLPNVLKAVAASGLIAVGGMLVSCEPPTGGPEIIIPEPEPEPEPGEELPEDHWSKIQQLKIDEVKAPIIRNDVFETVVRGQVMGSVKTVASEVNDMRRNIEVYGRALKNTPDRPGLPDDEFLTSISDFNAYAFLNGHNGRGYYAFEVMTDALLSLDGKMDGDAKALFTAYINAWRGVNFMSARHNKNDDYETKIDLGRGQVSVGELLQDINDKSGGASNYKLEGEYPDLYADMSALIPELDNAYPGLIRGVITEMGNFEQMLGMLQRAQSFGYDTKFTTEVNSAIRDATDGMAIYQYILIDKPQGGLEIGR